MSDKIPVWLPIPDAELKIQRALKLQELVNGIDWKLILNQIEATECNSMAELDEIKKSMDSIKSLMEQSKK